MSLLPPEETVGMSGRLPAAMVIVVAVGVHDEGAHDDKVVVAVVHDDVDARFCRLGDEKTGLGASPPTCR